jgi:hypothetical protein
MDEFLQHLAKKFTVERMREFFADPQYGVPPPEEKKLNKDYSTVQKVIANLAAGKGIRPFAGENMLDKDQLLLFNDMVKSRVPENEQLAIPRANPSIAVMTGHSKNAWDASRKLRIPRISSEGRF